MWLLQKSGGCTRSRTAARVRVPPGGAPEGAPEREARLRRQGQLEQRQHRRERRWPGSAVLREHARSADDIRWYPGLWRQLCLTVVWRCPEGGSSPPRGRSTEAVQPGLFGARYERAFYDGVQRLQSSDRQDALRCFQQADQHGSRRGVLSPALLSGIILTQLSQPADAIPYLERVTTAERASQTR